MRNVYLAQVNDTFGRNAFLPYSAGCLQAYALSRPEIPEHYEFRPLIYLKENIEQLALRLTAPDVLGLSSYIWNWEYNLALARAVKFRYPQCLVVMGGPQAPDHPGAFFQDHPYVDLLVHGEGEVAFAEVLLERLDPAPSYILLPGLSVRTAGGYCLPTASRQPAEDLGRLPSPYLSGVFDGLLGDGWDLHATQETHRGCPYECSFCQWGSAYQSRIRPLPLGRILGEMAWCGEKRIELLYNADANFGLAAHRDVIITRSLVDIHDATGYPQQLRAAYAKTAPVRVFEIARLLADRGMSKGVSLSLQSTHLPTLRAVRRQNISQADFAQQIATYRQHAIPTYTELIIGLPEETYGTFVRGVDQVLEAGQHEGLNIYPCLVLPNAEMAQPDYRERYGIKTVRSPLLQQHRTATRQPGVPLEWAEVVIETSTMPHADWLRAYLFAWAVQSLHCLGLTSYLAIRTRRDGVPYSLFYEQILGWARSNPTTVLGGELRYVETKLHWAARGGDWGTVLPAFGDIIWPLEEATFLRLSLQADRLYDELSKVYPPEAVAYQRELPLRPDQFPDLETFARHLWYGRKNPVPRMSKEA